MDSFFRKAAHSGAADPVVVKTKVNGYTFVSFLFRYDDRVMPVDFSLQLQLAGL